MNHFQKFYKFLKLVYQLKFFSLFNNENIAGLFLNFPVKLICFIAFGSASGVFFVYLNILQLPYNFLGDKNNLVNSQLCNHLLDQLRFFLMLSYVLKSFFTGWLKTFLPSIITMLTIITIFYFSFWKIICVYSSISSF